jgi:hypothetical protein
VSQTRCGRVSPSQFGFPFVGLFSDTGIQFMFLHHARANRLAAAYLLFTVVLLMVPKVDIPETPFDEGNTPTTEMLVVRADSSLEYRQRVTVFAPRIFAQQNKINLRKLLLLYPNPLTHYCSLRELFCSLLC